MFDMSKRGGGRESENGVDDELEQDRFSTPRPSSGSSATAPAARVREAAVIGPSIHIKGDLRGEEDLMIEGNVHGTIHLRDNSLTVGSNGKVKADVYAHNIFVDGTVEGDLFGSERVAIRKSGSVKGNIVSPRVSLEDGGRFKGSVEMDQQAVDAAFGHKGGRAPSAPTAAAATDGGSSAASARGSAEVKGPGAVSGGSDKGKDGERKAAGSGGSGG